MKQPAELGELIKLEPTPLRELVTSRGNRLLPRALGSVVEGLYVFWWIGDRKIILGSRRTIYMQGPSKKAMEVDLADWFPEGLKFIPLYVGKSTNLPSRVGQHLLLKTDSYRTKSGDIKYISRPKTTSCQLRHGIEVLFVGEPDSKSLMLDNVGLTVVPETRFATRFYLEDLAIGYLKPWFNLDTER